MIGERKRPGPRRRKGKPAGREEVRRAVLDAAARLFAQHGVGEVSLRDVAREADVQLALIARYVGTRDELVQATFEHLTSQLSEDVLSNPLQGHGFDADSTMGGWTRIAAYLALTGGVPEPGAVNPVRALADTIEEAYGLDNEAARVRGAQILASALGWRIFEQYLLAAGELSTINREVLRTDLTRMHRRLGSTPWPSPRDPPARKGRPLAQL